MITCDFMADFTVYVSNFEYVELQRRFITWVYNNDNFNHFFSTADGSKVSAKALSSWLCRITNPKFNLRNHAEIIFFSNLIFSLSHWSP